MDQATVSWLELLLIGYDQRLAELPVSGIVLLLYNGSSGSLSTLLQQTHQDWQQLINRHSSGD